MGIVNTEMIADYVILDAVMIKKLPRKIAAQRIAQGMDGGGAGGGDGHAGVKAGDLR